MHAKKKKVKRVQLAHTQLISCLDLNYLSKFTNKWNVSQWIIKKMGTARLHNNNPPVPLAKGQLFLHRKLERAIDYYKTQGTFS